MKTAAAPLVTFLNANTVGALAELYTLALLGGTTVRLTTAYADISWGGNTFTAAGSGTAPGLAPRGSIQERYGLDVGSLNITLLAGDAALLGGVRLPLAAINGALNGARMKVERAVLDAPGGTVQGVLTRFEGTVSQVKPTSTQVEIDLAPDLEELNREVPRNVFRPACNHDLFDAGCGLARASFLYTTTVTVGSSTTLVNLNHVYASEPLAGGTLTFTTGALAGVKRTIREKVSSTQVRLAVPLPSAPAVGDGVDITLGCDKTRGTCSVTFSNINRFRGFPWVPAPETGST